MNRRISPVPIRKQPKRAPPGPGPSSACTIFVTGEEVGPALELAQLAEADREHLLGLTAGMTDAAFCVGYQYALLGEVESAVDEPRLEQTVEGRLQRLDHPIQRVEIRSEKGVRVAGPAFKIQATVPSSVMGLHRAEQACSSLRT